MAPENSVQEMFNELLEGFYSFEKKVTGQFDQINSKFGDIDKRFDKVDRKFGEIDERFNKVDEKFDKLGKKVDKNSRKLTNIENEFRTFKKLVLQYGLDIEYLRDKMEEENIS